MQLIICIISLILGCFAHRGDHGIHHHHHQHCDHEDHFVTVPAPWGRTLGSTLTTRLNKTIFAFRGIRYANAARFQPSVMVEKWTEIYNATADGPLCPQPILPVDVVAEDCLFLNIYTKQLPTNKNPKLPVIIHLHPGGFYSATGQSAWAGPQYFMDQPIVLVTLNYRIGSLGFISTGTKEAPGNLGLKDQVVAIKWIKENIAAFGGDPDCITLYGYSAGAWSITLHMVSDMTRGLFHKAILGSGSALGHWPLPRHQLDLAKKQARIMGCPDDTPANIINCLKTKPAEDLGNSLFQFNEFLFDPILKWSPVIEEDFGQERFISENPVKLYENGKFMKIPVMAGITKDEFGPRAYAYYTNESVLRTFDEQWEKLAPLAFIYERDTEKSKEVSRAIRKFYLNNQPLSNDSFEAIEKVACDSIVGFPAYRAVNLISQNNPQPVFYYKFTYQGRFSHFYLPNTNNSIYGVVHHDDLIYTFYISRLFPFFNQTDPESEMVEKLTTLLSNFAKHGNPIPSTTPKLDNVVWPPYNKRTKKYMNIGDKLIVKEKMFQERYSFWESLFPLNINN